MHFFDGIKVHRGRALVHLAGAVNHARAEQDALGECRFPASMWAAMPLLRMF
jgi:hypothetical protein